MLQEQENTLSVSEFIEQINESISSHATWVEGEITDLRVSSGKWLHFDIKDEDARLHCFSIAFRIKTPLEDGMQVRVFGTPRVYPKYGKFSITVQQVKPTGEGALRRAFELLRQKLESEGLFDPSRKREIPRFPERIGLITSEDAAAYTDFLKVLHGRRGGMELRVLSVPVQGRDAPSLLRQAIEYLSEKHTDLDALVLVRGGGSIEDLHAFNDEMVIRAIARSRIPTIVGVGHERDTTLADFVADVRASTPSNAAELLTPTRQEIAQAVQSHVYAIQQGIRQQLAQNERHVIYAASQLRELVSYPLREVESLSHRMMHIGKILHIAIAENKNSIVRDEISLRNVLRQSLKEKYDRLESVYRVLQSLDPRRVLARGYSITRDKKGMIIRDASQVEEGDHLVTTLKRGILSSIIDHKNTSWQTRKTSQKRTKSSKKSSKNSKQATLI